MKRHDRLNALLDALAGTGEVDVEEMAARLAVSASTVRRDLNHLTEQQLVTRTRGGAVAAAVSYDLPMRYKAPKHQHAKARIGQAAARLVGNNDIIALNGGTTTTEVARNLATRDAGGTTPAVTIVTNAINIAGELTVRRHLKLVLTGGSVKARSFELIGPFAMDTLNQIDLDLAVLGAECLDPTGGVKAMDSDEAQISRLMAARARRVIVVADSSKLRARGFARVCGWDQVSVLVTDDQAPAADLETIRAAGVEIVTA